MEVNEAIEDAEVIIEEPVDDTAEEVEETIEAENEAEEEAGDNVVTFGDDKAPEEESDIPAPEWVKDLRKQNRKLSRENADLKKAKADVKPSSLSAKPTLEGASYDEDKYAAQLGDWYAEKRTHDDAETAKETAAEEQQQAWQSRLGEYKNTTLG